MEEAKRSAPEVKVIAAADIPKVELPLGSWSKLLLTAKSAGAAKMMLGYSVFTPGTRTSHLIHEEEEMCYIARGEGSIDVNGKAYRFKKGDAIYIPAGVPHAVVNDGREDVEMVFAFSFPDYPPTERI